jgi:hypothetical protein
MLICEDKVHADFEIFDDEAPMPQINAALTVTPAAHPSVPGFIPLMAPMPAATPATEGAVEAIQVQQGNLIEHKAEAPPVVSPTATEQEAPDTETWASRAPALEEQAPEAPNPIAHRMTTIPTAVAAASRETTVDDEDPDFMLDDEIDLGIGSASIFSFGAGATSDDRADDIIVEDSEPQQETGPLLDLLHIHVKAASLVAMLPRSRELQRIYTRKLVSILSHFPHRNSAQAIERMLSQGASIDFIEDCAQLKLHWEGSSQLWLSVDFPRRNAIDNFSPQVSRANRFLNWTTAAHILQTCPLTDALALIETDWIEDWRKLHKFSAHKMERDAFSYQGFLRNRPPNFRMSDPEDWPYDEIIERRP